MKLVRYAYNGGKAIGALLENEEAVIDLSLAAPAGDSMSAFLAAGEQVMTAAKELMSRGQRIPLQQVQLLSPVADPQKIMCIGLNYRDHCEEQNQPLPEKAILFAKYANTLNNPGEAVRMPAVSDKIDYEAELAVVIGRKTSRVTLEEAWNCVAGYMCANDVTARDIQKGDGQWVRGKSPDTFFPTGPWLCTRDEVPDAHNLDISLTLNGQIMQQSNTSNLIFRIDWLISYLSQTMTLLPGDILSTGTPGGVGVYRNPPCFLKPGDVMKVSIAGLGTLTSHVTGS